VLINETDPANSENQEQVKVCVVLGLGRINCVIFFVSQSTAIASSFLQTLVFCTQQLYYEPLQEREKLGRTNVALVRGDKRKRVYRKAKEESSDDGTTVARKQQQ